MNWKPLYEKIVVQMLNKQEIQSETGLTFTKDLSLTNHTTIKGKVVAVGDGRLMSDGTLVPLKVKVGDTENIKKMQGESYEDGKSEYTILSESNILAIIEED